MKNEKLDELVKSGTILRYHYEHLNSEGFLFDKKTDRDSRTTERLTLEFPNGKSLVIDTFCSGSAENTVMFFDKACS